MKIGFNEKLWNMLESIGKNTGGIRGVFVYGSYAAGSEGPYSDINIGLLVGDSFFEGSAGPREGSSLPISFGKLLRKYKESPIPDKIVFETVVFPNFAGPEAEVKNGYFTVPVTEYIYTENPYMKLTVTYFRSTDKIKKFTVSDAPVKVVYDPYGELNSLFKDRFVTFHDGIPKKTPFERFPYEIRKEFAAILISMMDELAVSFAELADAWRRGDILLMRIFHQELIKIIARMRSIIFNNTGNWAKPRLFLEEYITPAEKGYLERALNMDDPRRGNNVIRLIYDWAVDTVEEAVEAVGSAYPELAHTAENRGDTVIEFMEKIRLRVYLYNFRRVRYTSNIFRSGTPADYFEDEESAEFFMRVLKKYDIGVILDFRREDEREGPFESKMEKLYDDLGIKHVIVDFNTPPGCEEGLDGYIRAVRCAKKAVAEIFRLILEFYPRGVLFHCVAGRDRTGVAAVLIQMLLGVNRERIISEYLATGFDVKHHRIIGLMEEIERCGGIRKYLMDCGLTSEFLDEFVRKIYDPEKYYAVII